MMAPTPTKARRLATVEAERILEAISAHPDVAVDIVVNALLNTRAAEAEYLGCDERAITFRQASQGGS